MKAFAMDRGVSTVRVVGGPSSLADSHMGSEWLTPGGMTRWAPGSGSRWDTLDARIRRAMSAAAAAAAGSLAEKLGVGLMVEHWPARKAALDQALHGWTVMTVSGQLAVSIPSHRPKSCAIRVGILIRRATLVMKGPLRKGAGKIAIAMLDMRTQMTDLPLPQRLACVRNPGVPFSQCSGH